MTLGDNGDRCLTCRFFDDHESTCKRFPPAFRHTTTGEDGEHDVWWLQPTIDLEWATTCGEWSPDVVDEATKQRIDRVMTRMKEWEASRNA